MDTNRKNNYAGIFCWNSLSISRQKLQKTPGKNSSPYHLSRTEGLGRERRDIIHWRMLTRRKNAILFRYIYVLTNILWTTLGTEKKKNIRPTRAREGRADGFRATIPPSSPLVVIRDLNWRKITTTTTGAEAAAAGGWGSPIVNIQRDSRQKTEDRKVTHLLPFEGENWGKRGGQWPRARAGKCTLLR